MQLNGFKMFKI